VRRPERAFFGIGYVEYRGKKVAVSNLERSVVDVLSMPQYDGGSEEIIRFGHTRGYAGTRDCASG